MIKYADLSKYGSIIEDIELFIDALPVEAVLLSPGKEVVAGNQPAVEKGLIDGVKCHKGWVNLDNPCPWCLAGETIKSGEVVDHIVCAGFDDQGKMIVVEKDGIIIDAHWYPVAKDLYIHFVGICHKEPELREEAYKNIKALLEVLSPENPGYADDSINSIIKAAEMQP
ncbi:MAG: hypothetical protein HN737_07045 [Desulfobacterales bacterium]|jgi:hypothetical protein|nr:hypothetical protein [Desulfobacteraceae bacterium]MBT4363239.1 hypothetical protein [Desulfobacteraceae bacterium]MBT7084827.1 hypothetical protein [Desulfobacterales bacterium]MBT7697151.1 hypothetical protein [Desulfobacterales bacterium]